MAESILMAISKFDWVTVVSQIICCIIISWSDVSMLFLTPPQLEQTLYMSAGLLAMPVSIRLESVPCLLLEIHIVALCWMIWAQI